MNEIEIFKNEEFGEIRTAVVDGKPWFVGKDVCNVFGDTNHNRSLGRIDDVDKSFVDIKDSLGRNQKAIIINESGLYALLFAMQPQKSHIRDGVSDEYPIEIQNRIDKLHRFKRWVTSEVLPTIRKHGAYMSPEVIEQTIADPDFIIRLATALKEERAEKELALQTIDEQKPLVDFANKVSDSASLIDMGKMAKLLKDEHIDIGRNRLFEWLRRKKILMKNNIPYQKYIEGGYFKVKETVCETPYGVKTFVTTKVTGKGQIYIMEKLREEFNNIKSLEEAL